MGWKERKTGFREFSEPIVAVAALLTIVSIIATWKTNSGEFEILLTDQLGFPCSDLAIESPDGPRYADEHGKILARDTWNGSEITVHDSETWRIVDTCTVMKRKHQRVVRIIIKRKDIYTSGY